MTHKRSTPWGSAEATAWGAIVLLAFSLRAAALDRHELWLDESCTSYVVHYFAAWPAEGPPWAEVAHLPYFALLKSWSVVAGETAVSLRYFSVLVGVAAVVMVGLLGRKAAGRAAGIVALLLAATNPLHIHYCREARVYALWTLVIAACACLLRRAADSERRRDWAAFAFAAWLAVFVHYYTLLWLPSTLAAVLVTQNRGRFIRRWLITVGSLALALIPMMLILVVPNAGTGPRRWLQEAWAEPSAVPIVARSILALLPAGWYPNYLGEVGAADEWLAAVWGKAASTALTVTPAALLVGLFTWMAVSRYGLAKASAVPDACEAGVPIRGFVGSIEPQGNIKESAPRGREGQPGEWLWLLTLSLGFLSTAWLCSTCWRPMYVVGRYDLAAWPTLVAALALAVVHVGRGARTAARRWALPGALTLVLILSSAAVLRAAWAVEPSRDTAERVRRLSAAVDEGDLVISVGLYRWFLDHELRARGNSLEWLSFPPNHDGQLCWEDAQSELAAPGELESGVREVLARVDRALQERRGVWLLAQGEPGTPRWDVDRRLFETLAGAGVEIDLRDEWLGLAALRRGN